MLKKETNISNEKIIICVGFIRIKERSFVGKKPPDEITDIDSVNGSFFSLDLKYFFPITKSIGSPFKPGPIE